jgi:hypothetical protein
VREIPQSVQRSRGEAAAMGGAQTASDACRVTRVTPGLSCSVSNTRSRNRPVSENRAIVNGVRRLHAECKAARRLARVDAGG